MESQVRRCRTTWREYFALATPAQLAAERVWGLSRKSVQDKLRASGDLERIDLQTATFADTGKPVPFQWCLNGREAEWLHTYMQQSKAHRGGACFGLIQNPDDHCSENIGLQYLQTIIRNVGLLYSEVHHRWMVPLEVLNAQCFPVYGSAFGEECSFSRPRPTARKRSHVFAQAGNSMHGAVIGLCLAW
eukprot:4111173-Pyramimonas_sp.AAC.1